MGVRVEPLAVRAGKKELTAEVGKVVATNAFSREEREGIAKYAKKSFAAAIAHLLFRIT
jgi:hypothetical protein